MRDEDKSKEQLLKEMKALRQRVAVLESAEAEHKQTKEALRQSQELLTLLTDRIPVPIAYIGED